LSGRSRPLNALAVILASWISFRILALYADQQQAFERLPRTSVAIPSSEQVRLARTAANVSLLRKAERPKSQPAFAIRRPKTAPSQSADQSFRGPQPSSAPQSASFQDAGRSLPAEQKSAALSSEPIQNFLQPRSEMPVPRRPLGITGSAWVLVRQNSLGPRLAEHGQLGGSQAGIRVYLPIGDGVRLTGRLSTPLSGAGKDASVGFAFRRESIPIELLLERRVAFDRLGRNAFAATLVSNFASKKLVKGWEAEGYGQAGMVGLRQRYLFADGALQLRREIGQVGKARLLLGGGLWAATQKGASRLDAGPSVSLRLKNVGLSLEWRQRLAGKAEPQSGPSLTLSSSF
jgi:hypothetical protein